MAEVSDAEAVALAKSSQHGPAKLEAEYNLVRLHSSLRSTS